MPHSIASRACDFHALTTVGSIWSASATCSGSAVASRRTERTPASASSSALSSSIPSSVVSGSGFDRSRHATSAASASPDPSADVSACPRGVQSPPRFGLSPFVSVFPVGVQSSDWVGVSSSDDSVPVGVQSPSRFGPFDAAVCPVGVQSPDDSSASSADPQSPELAATHSRSSSPNPRTCEDRRSRSSPDPNDHDSECQRRIFAATPELTPASTRSR
ncbi:hypothetical protein HFX_1511 [Haloferax mediterranei ATCC 33500]|uniref:Uncharacterized protein n=1 Tax=Haloferax mediterranei (strain ATCC 33500 / DSM 1411 / JCM 8866 / NBRC 14739 / NCIMB 2177 / R-4) TaxID=523841 RepID=I3R4Q8_HALMT|nr:hypothetical protein HFX_1511 [Haloferax mediterranei ATCC 33500]